MKQTKKERSCDLEYQKTFKFNLKLHANLINDKKKYKINNVEKLNTICDLSWNNKVKNKTKKNITQNELNLTLTANRSIGSKQVLCIFRVSPAMFFFSFFLF